MGQSSGLCEGGIAELFRMSSTAISIENLSPEEQFFRPPPSVGAEGLVMG